MSTDIINTIIKAGSTLFKNRFDNLPVLCKSRPLEDLHNAYSNKTAILVASGPSLSKNIDLLRTVNNRAIIVACDSAVVPLLNHNIIPDYIVTADYGNHTYKKLKSVRHLLSDTPLIMLSSSCTQIPNIIQFKEIYYTTLNDTTNTLMNNLLNDNNIPLIEAVCVFNLALHAVQLMGCSTVIFTGLDLSYYNGRDHVPGTVLDWGNNHKENKNSIYITGIDNTPVHSSNGFIVMKEIIENQIKEYPNTLYIDCTEGGAKVEGTVIDVLSNTIANMSINNTIGPWLYTMKEKRYNTVLDNLYVLRDELHRIQRILMQYIIHKRKVQKHINKHGFVVMPVDIEKCIIEMDTLNDTLNNDSTMSYTKELTASYYDEYMNRTTQQDTSPTTNLNQQIFVQEIRLKAINTFMDIVNEQIEIIGNKI